MHCPYCGVDYSPNEPCLCHTASASKPSDAWSAKSQSPVLEYPGETDAFCSLSTDPGRGGIP